VLLECVLLEEVGINVRCIEETSSLLYYVFYYNICSTTRQLICIINKVVKQTSESFGLLVYLVYCCNKRGGVLCIDGDASLLILICVGRNIRMVWRSGTRQKGD